MTETNPTLLNRPNSRELVQGALLAIDYFEAPLQAALDAAGNTHTLDDIFTSIVLGRVEWHANDDCFAICEFVRFPQLSHYHIWLAGALPRHGESLRTLERTLASRARELGATHLTMAGRSGWVRATPDHWRAYNSMLRMEVDSGQHQAN